MARNTAPGPPFADIEAYEAWFNDTPARQLDAEKAEQLLLFEMGFTPAKVRTAKQIDRLLDREMEKGHCYNDQGEWVGCMPDFDVVEALKNLRTKVVARKGVVSIERTPKEFLRRA